MFLGSNYEAFMQDGEERGGGNLAVFEFRDARSSYAALEDGCSVLFGYIPDYTEFHITIP